MENFSLLTISGQRLPSFALKSVPDLTCPVHKSSLPDCLLAELQSGEPPQQNCTIYRPWYSPYSYFVCMDQDSQTDSCGFPGTLGGNSLEAPADTGPAGDMDSGSSSSGSLEKMYPQESGGSSSSSRKATDCITSQDILLASKWRPPHGCQCVACCRMFPTLHSLKAHIKRGAREGFSCRVYYHKLKALWGKERKWRPSKHPAGSHKMLK
ncbi:spermatogenesis-associated protein 46 [Podarcis raffonei]|uniref:spermatogenesis-associated protein 46 n=1 Tax=Podarcis raffonei TaxID=65483 RepID=UPI0023290EF6|nr:spermatogenesis-associated protein 46 [Podarcis raffonei]